MAPRAAEGTATPTPETYFDILRQLTGASPAEQLALRQQARTTYREQPDAVNRLRLILMLASDHRSLANLQRARELLAELLAGAEVLPSELTALLRWQAQQLQGRLQLLEELALLRQQLAEHKVALIEAEAKLEALTSIEQTLEATTPEPVAPQ